MALRIETRIGTLLALTLSAIWAQPFSGQVRHRHLHGGATGSLEIDADGIRFTEPGKKAEHSRQWSYAEIQQLSLGAAKLGILTYEDRKWQFGRDREYVFDRLPQDLAERAYPFLARNLDQRLIAELADPGAAALWQINAKLRHGLGGSQGTILISDDRIVYKAMPAGESRTWRLEDIDNIATAGPFDLAITTLEHSGSWRASPTEFRFQLKEPLAEDRYNELWRRIYRARSEQAQPNHRQAGQ